MLFALLQFLFILPLLIYSLAPHSFILRLNPLMAVKGVAFVFACWLCYVLHKRRSLRTFGDVL